MEGFEKRMMKQFEELRLVNEKLNAIEGICSRLEAMDLKLEQQGTRIDQVQMKVDLSWATLGKVQQEQVQEARALKIPSTPPSSSSPLSPEGVLGAPPAQVRIGAPPPPPPPPPRLPLVPYRESSSHTAPVDVDSSSDTSGKKGWVPKMDFPRFDGIDAKIWVDKCEAFFELYQIHEDFKVTSASLYLTDNAAHWYQAFKMSSACHNWAQFRAAVLLEFDVNVHRDKMKSLLLLKQTGTVEEYKTQFLQLVYAVRLYEQNLSDTFLVTRFVTGLKDELRAHVEMQLPTTVQQAVTYAVVQENL